MRMLRDLGAEYLSKVLQVAPELETRYGMITKQSVLVDAKYVARGIGELGA